MTEKEKMLAGELYNGYDEPALKEELARARRLCEQYNRTPGDDRKAQNAILDELLGGHGSILHVEPHVWFDYGYNTTVGEDFYCNHDCVFLDCNKITFGDHVFIGPQCGFYTAEHPLDAAMRNLGLESAKPIAVGNNVWIGGHVTVLAGVTIGDNCVIGAGSVVTRDIPANSVAVGNPARPVKKV